MKFEGNFRLSGKKVDLVPFVPEMSEEYHRWLQDSDLRESTGTEPMSLEDVQGVQQEWEQDLNVVALMVEDKQHTLVGDVNLFVKEDTAEVNVMIAEVSGRRKGYATEALQLVMKFGLVC
eukprot:Platyproteum_vivax@DN1532_c0_g1_i1.p1